MMEFGGFTEHLEFSNEEIQRIKNAVYKTEESWEFFVKQAILFHMQNRDDVILDSNERELLDMIAASHDLGKKDALWRLLTNKFDEIPRPKPIRLAFDKDGKFKRREGESKYMADNRVTIELVLEFFLAKRFKRIVNQIPGKEMGRHVVQLIEEIVEKEDKEDRICLLPMEMWKLKNYQERIKARSPREALHILFSNTIPPRSHSLHTLSSEMNSIDVLLRALGEERDEELNKLRKDLLKYIRNKFGYDFYGYKDNGIFTKLKSAVLSVIFNCWSYWNYRLRQVTVENEAKASQ